MRQILSGLCLLLCFSAVAQTSNLQLGHQEFPAQIGGQAADAEGNQYYAGSFRGELKINNQVLTAGRGLDDLFLVKTNPQGAVTRFRTYGTAYAEMISLNTLALGRETTLTFAARYMDRLTFGALSADPYLHTDGSKLSTTAIVHSDTAGNIRWVARTSQHVLRIVTTADLIHVFTELNSFNTPVRFNDSTLIASNTAIGLGHFMLDYTGKLRSFKTITKANPSMIQLLQVGVYSDNTIMLGVVMNEQHAFQMNGQPVPLPSMYGNYHVLIRTDTSYGSPRVRVMNPGRHGFIEYQPGAVAAGIPMHLSASDSIYSIVTIENSLNGPYTLDGHTVPYHTNTLLVFDADLNLRRTVALSPSHLVAGVFTSPKRKLHFRQIQSIGQRLVFTGTYLGTNEAPVNAIPVRDTSVFVLPGIKASLDLNGPGKGFIATAGLDLSNGKVVWYGDNSPYETSGVFPLFLNKAGGGRVTFVQRLDNIFNPWTYDEALNLVQGGIKAFADGPEITHQVQYLSDGSRVVMGYARGRTALDMNDLSVRNNPYRRDVFITRILPDGRVVWFRRFMSTTIYSNIKRMVVRNDRIYFLATFSNPVNENNFLQVNGKWYPHTTMITLLAQADINGNISVMNLEDPVYKDVTLNDFDFFSNGDLAILCGTGLFHQPGFPSNLGFYLIRADGTTGRYLDGRKIMSNFVSTASSRIVVDKDDFIYFTTMALNNGSAFSYKLHDGRAYIDSIPVLFNLPGQHRALVKMQWNGFKWLKRTMGDASVYASPGEDLFLFNNAPVLHFSPMIDNKPLYWDGDLLYQGPDRNFSILVQLDTSGRIKNKKMMASGFYSNSGRKAPGERLFLSGYIIKPIKADTIQIGHNGMADAVGLILEANLTAKYSYRLHTPHGETMYDFDTYRDSLATFAYTAQTNPALSRARGLADESDYEEDAFITSSLMKGQTPTGLNDPLPPGTTVSVTPNPVKGGKLVIAAQTGESLSSTLYLYNGQGQFAGSKAVTFTTGTSRHQWQLPEGTAPGVYRLVIVNKKWRTTRSVVVL